MADRILIEARNRVVAVEGGTIVEPADRFDLVLRFPDADVRPGLINAHDHLHRNHYGRLGDPPYADSYEWVDDIRVRYGDEIAVGKAMPRRDMLLAGAWKNLFAGVTTVVHHDRWEPDFDDRFPLRVARIAWANSLGMTPELEGIDPDQPYCLHLAEGISPKAKDEVRRLDDRGLLGPNLIAVHGVGIEGEGAARFRASGAALVWCPSSNLFLLGRTVAAELVGEGLDVLLGSDSLLTGEGNLLDELRLARTLGLLSHERLEAAVGEVAARRLGLRPPSLEPGEPADLAVLSRPLLEAGAEDVQLVLVDGMPRVAAPDLPGFDGPLVTDGGVTRRIDEGPGKTGAAMNRLPSQAALQG
jgi:cytosine/adenosine deaminase-related metal-dependent hydrolase